MDELDIIRRFRADVADPTDDEVAAARRLLAQRMGPTSVPSRRASYRRMWRLVAVVAIVATAVAVIVPVLLPGDAPGGATSVQAAAALHRFALTAKTQRAEAAPTIGQFYYTEVRSSGTMLYIPGGHFSPFEVTYQSSQQTWLGPDGSSRTRTSASRVTLPSPADRAAWEAAGSPEVADLAPPVGDQTSAPGGDFLDLSQLPTDPGKLKAALEERKIVGGPDGDWETLAIIGQMLQETYASPSLRAALFNVAAALPGIEYIGKTTDASGRPGVAVAYTHGGIRDELIFDPHTAQLNATNSWLVDPGAVGIDPASEPAGTAVAYAGRPGLVYANVYLSSGVVDSDDADA